ncbi:IS701 family transposase [Streptomyces albofaciens]|uniref:IS701 family transposase n=1 Tax=Streptomyces albofaciens TaxID=66866 RepID=UPI003CC7917E
MPAARTAVPPPLPGRPASTQDAWIEDLCRHLFVSFTRADHHLKGEQYVRGLLTAPGRKSIRNIARTLEDTGAAQRLHHFICNAPWNWRAVREALSEYLVRRARPRSWVVRPMLIPKSGTNSVGVHRRFVPATGQLVNGQLAYGLWYANQSLVAPVDWRLHLPAPDSGPFALSDEGVARVLSLARRSACPETAELPPMVWDSQMHHAADVLGALTPLGLPVMARTPGSLPLLLVDRYGRPSRRGALPAQRILAAPERFSLPVHNVAPGVRAILARVAPARTGESGGAGELLLYAQRYEDAEAYDGHGTGARADFWLTTSAVAGKVPAELHLLTRTAARVARDSVRTGGRTGLRDFEGRSYDGWHRHMTLASAAYLVQTLTALDAVRSAREAQRPCAPEYAYPSTGAPRGPGRRVCEQPLTLVG